MADAREHFEAIGYCDEIFRAFGGYPPDGIVSIAPDVEHGQVDRAERRADRAAGPIPGEGCFHRILVAEHANVLRDRRSRNAASGQPLAEPFRIVSQQQIRSAWFEKGLVVPRALRLI